MVIVGSRGLGKLKGLAFSLMTLTLQYPAWFHFALPRSEIISSCHGRPS